MVGRPRKAGRKHWPRYMYKNSGGIFWFRDPITGEVTSLGSVESRAINDAIRLNKLVGQLKSDRTSGDVDNPVDEDGLVSTPSIRTLAKPVSASKCGVYFLLSEGEIVYIGRSIDCTRRLLEHIAAPSKAFDSYHIIECDAKAIDELEARYIRKFRPMLNINRRRLPPSARDADCRLDFDEL